MTELMNPLVSSVSAFFPCYNDALSIGKMVRDVHAGLESAVDDFEVIVVNDGSQDDSLAVLHELATEFPRLRIVDHEVNRGYGGALLSGFAAATKQWVFYTDGDAQYDAAEIVRCIAAVQAGTDVVQGYKIGRGDPWHRKVIGRAYHHVVKLLFGLRVRDTDCDFRLIRQTVLDKVTLRSTTGVICVEMMCSFQRADANFVQVGVNHYARPHGRSQFFRLPAITRSAVQLLQLWWRLMVRRYI
ncbi:MAG TPA: glycosyltransferase family 2 protein [Ilumatobacteraceae bacterium]|nr:glycosyltransferase family 2 protein [Ilumatobacteraceae bacterium]